MRNDSGLTDELNTLLATETRSLARHVQAEARPYITPETFPIWKRLERLGRTSLAHAKRLSALIETLELPPRSIPFPTGVAGLHFMNIQRLLPDMIQEKEVQIAAYERALDHAGNCPEAQPALQSLLEENRQSLQDLQQDRDTLGEA